MENLHSFRAVYPAERAAALSGVPKTTVYYWAREGIYVPSISPTREKLWSFSDLLAMRAIYWLRQDKPRAAKSTMRAVRSALAAAAEKNVKFGQLDLIVDVEGTIFHRDVDGHLVSIEGQHLLEETVGHLNLFSEYRVAELRGPDLRRPRENLRILPGKLGGEPHVEGTRISTAAVAALNRRGFSDGRIMELYPGLQSRRSAIGEALELESQLEENLRPAA